MMTLTDDTVIKLKSGLVSKNTVLIDIEYCLIFINNSGIDQTRVIRPVRIKLISMKLVLFLKSKLILSSFSFFNNNLVIDFDLKIHAYVKKKVIPITNDGTRYIAAYSISEVYLELSIDEFAKINIDVI